VTPSGGRGEGTWRKRKKMDETSSGVGSHTSPDQRSFPGGEITGLEEEKGETDSSANVPTARAKNKGKREKLKGSAESWPFRTASLTWEIFVGGGGASPKGIAERKKKKIRLSLWEYSK